MYVILGMGAGQGNRSCGHTTLKSEMAYNCLLHVQKHFTHIYTPHETQLTLFMEYIPIFLWTHQRKAEIENTISSTRASFIFHIFH